MFAKIAAFSLLASVVAANAVPFAEHAPLAARNDDVTTTSTQFVYVTITQTLPQTDLTQVTPGPKPTGNGTHTTNASGYLTSTVVGTNTTVPTGPNVPQVSDVGSGAVNVQAGKVLGLMGAVAVAFLL